MHDQVLDAVCFLRLMLIPQYSLYALEYTDWTGRRGPPGVPRSKVMHEARLTGRMLHVYFSPRSQLFLFFDTNTFSRRATSAITGIEA